MRQVKTAIVTSPGQSAASQGLNARDLAAAIDWWRDAGVDHHFLDEAREWLKQPASAGAAAPPIPVAAAPPPPPVARIGGTADSWPATLDAFAPWWLTEPSLDGGQVSQRVAPRGPAGAPLMVLVDHPESDDTERLLSGPQGRLLDAMLAAMGIAPDNAYIAACLPRHMPLPDWTALHEAGLSELTAHHIRLAAPRRLIVFGSHISSLLGHDPTKSAEPLRHFNHEATSVSGLVLPGLGSLIGRPRGKARIWDAWLAWTAGQQLYGDDVA